MVHFVHFDMLQPKFKTEGD